MIKRDRTDNALFSPSTLEFGKLHLTILTAVHAMDSRRWITVKKTGRLVSRDLTEFGKEVGLDEIHWWVFKQETNIDELQKQTERVLRSAERLKGHSEKLQKKEPQSYKDLLLSLKEFAEQHAREVGELLEYVSWLEKRNPMAPRILFTYRVWGSTRMSDRQIKIAPDTPLTDDLVRASTEIVLGVRMDGHRVYDETYNELAHEICDSMDPEEMSYGGKIGVAENRAVRATARAVYQECANYFRHLRDSLHHILIEVEKLDEQRNLLHSDTFWREFIIKAARSKKTETQLWDFKETLPMWHIKQQPARDEAKINFAEDVAALANARGGVLVIGVNDRRQIVGLGGSSRDIENWLKATSDTLARHLHYDRDVALLKQIVIQISQREAICLLAVVKQTSAPVGVRDSQGRYSYPIRRETGIERVSASNIAARKAGLKSDNHDFIIELEMFVHEN